MPLCNFVYVLIHEVAGENEPDDIKLVTIHCNEMPTIT